MNDQTVPANKSRTNKPAAWFWVITLAALAWYIMDTMAFAMRITMNEASLANMPEKQQLMIKDMPAWVNAVFAFEVFGGLFGSIALLLRRRFAQILFVISLFGVLGQTFYIWFISGHAKQVGAMAYAMPTVAIIISLIMIFISRTAASRGWLR